ncbi:MAG: hypothetical protein EOP82_06395, partial [Variovorax sp.]
MTAFDIRVGEGWDVHQLVAGRKLVLGGVEVPHVTGLLGPPPAGGHPSLRRRGCRRQSSRC